MSYSCKSLQNGGEVWFKDLRKIILLRKRSYLARSMEKYQRTLIAVSNCSPRINRRRMAAIKLVLYASWVAPLPLFPRHSLLDSPPSNQECNLIRPEYLQPLLCPEYIRNGLKESSNNLCCSEEGLLISCAPKITPLLKSNLQVLWGTGQLKLLN